MFSRTVFLVLVILLASIVVWIQVRPHSYLTDFGYLWGNAAQVANPEYQLAFQGDVRREFFALGMDITVDSHSRNNSSEPSERVVEISEDWLGRIAFKRLPEDPMAHYLETFRGGRGSDSQAKARAAEQTEELKSDELATVVVELSEPMSEVYVEEEFGLDLAEWKRFFLSGSRPSPEKPVYWWPGKGGCSATLLIDHQCDNPSAISQFRQWVRRLNDGGQEEPREARSQSEPLACCRRPRAGLRLHRQHVQPKSDTRPPREARSAYSSDRRALGGGRGVKFSSGWSPPLGPLTTTPTANHGPEPGSPNSPACSAPTPAATSPDQHQPASRPGKDLARTWVPAHPA